jgi:hypothetical protein
VRGTLASHVDISANPPPGVPASLEYASRASVETMVLTPQIGYLQTIFAGFALGIDFGARFRSLPARSPSNATSRRS